MTPAVAAKQRAVGLPGLALGIPWLMAAEGFSALLGFGVTLHLARRLGPDGFASVEYAAALAAWLLVLVRSGIEQVVLREASRRPRLIGPLTDLLLGLKLAGALAGLGLIVGMAWMVGGGRSPALVASGLLLVSSSFVPDIAPRASGRLGVVALAQAVRTLMMATWAWWLVRGPGDVATAAAAAGVGETAAVAILTVWMIRRGFHPPTPRFRASAWRVFARRGAVASAGRIARVGLFALDMLVLGGLPSEVVAPYAAQRRLAFALVALGLVIPTAHTPAIARAWGRSRDDARSAISRASRTIASFAIAATAGLLLVAGPAAIWLFGPSYRAEGFLTIAVAARIPGLLLASFAQAALVALRREDLALRLVLGMWLVAAIVVTLATHFDDPAGVAWSIAFVESAGAAAGLTMLAGLMRADAGRPSG